MAINEQIEERMVHMQDLAKYPLIAYVNPNEPQENRDKIMENCKVIKEVVENAGVDLGQVIIVKRTVFEFIDPPKPLKPIFENTTTCNECCGNMVKRTVEEQIKHEMELIKKKLNIKEK